MSDKPSILFSIWQNQKVEKLEENKVFLQALKQNKDLNFEVQKKVHDEVFDDVDCLACANCCKTTPPLYTTKDIKRIAKHLSLSPKQFKNKYTIEDINGDVVGISVPCTFLNEDNTCNIYEVRPLACRTYPHTDDRAFIHRPELNLNNTVVCPAAFHIVRRLKTIDGEG